MADIGQYKNHSLLQVLTTVGEVVGWMWAWDGEKCRQAQGQVGQI